jgi:hypothetical protein
MNKFAGVTIFGIALAVMLALGIPGKANAFANDNGTNGRLILAGGLDISVGGGGVNVDINKDKSEQEREQASGEHHCVSHCRHHYEERLKECNDPGHEHHRRCEEWAREREQECLNTCK